MKAKVLFVIFALLFLVACNLSQTDVATAIVKIDAVERPSTISAIPPTTTFDLTIEPSETSDITPTSAARIPSATLTPTQTSTPSPTPSLEIVVSYQGTRCGLVLDSSNPGILVMEVGCGLLGKASAGDSLNFRIELPLGYQVVDGSTVWVDSQGRTFGICGAPNFTRPGKYACQFQIKDSDGQTYTVAVPIEIVPAYSTPTPMPGNGGHGSGDGSGDGGEGEGNIPPTQDTCNPWHPGCPEPTQPPPTDEG